MQTSKGEIFVKHSSKLQPIYSIYCANQPTILSTLRQLEANPEFTTFLKKSYKNSICRKQDLHSFLIMPLQRLCRYPLFCKELLKFTDSDSKASFQKGMDEIILCVEKVNERVKQVVNLTKLAEITLELSNSSQFRDFIVDADHEFVMKEKFSFSGKKSRGYLFNHFLMVSHPLPTAEPIESNYNENAEKKEKVKYEISAILPLKLVNFVDSSDYTGEQPSLNERKEKAEKMVLFIEIDKSQFFLQFSNARKKRKFETKLKYLKSNVLLPSSLPFIQVGKSNVDIHKLSTRKLSRVIELTTDRNNSTVIEKRNRKKMFASPLKRKSTSLSHTANSVIPVQKSKKEPNKGEILVRIPDNLPSEENQSKRMGAKRTGSMIPNLLIPKGKTSLSNLLSPRGSSNNEKSSDRRQTSGSITSRSRSIPNVAPSDTGSYGTLTLKQKLQFHSKSSTSTEMKAKSMKKQTSDKSINKLFQPVSSNQSSSPQTTPQPPKDDKENRNHKRHRSQGNFELKQDTPSQKKALFISSPSPSPRNSDLESENEASEPKKSTKFGIDVPKLAIQNIPPPTSPTRRLSSPDYKIDDLFLSVTLPVKDKNGVDSTTIKASASHNDFTTTAVSSGKAPKFKVPKIIAPSEFMTPRMLSPRMEIPVPDPQKKATTIAIAGASSSASGSKIDAYASALIKLQGELHKEQCLRIIQQDSYITCKEKYDKLSLQFQQQSDRVKELEKNMESLQEENLAMRKLLISRGHK